MNDKSTFGKKKVQWGNIALVAVVVLLLAVLAIVIVFPDINPSTFVLKFTAQKNEQAVATVVIPQEQQVQVQPTVQQMKPTSHNTTPNKVELSERGWLRGDKVWKVTYICTVDSRNHTFGPFYYGSEEEVVDGGIYCKEQFPETQVEERTDNTPFLSEARADILGPNIIIEGPSIQQEQEYSGNNL